MKELDAFDVALGKVLRNHRKTKRLTSTQVGEKIGCTHQMVSLYELGKSPLTVTMLKKFCSVYGLVYYEVMQEAEEIIGH